MNNLTTFNSEEFGEVRTIEVNGKQLFIGSDVARALGYAIPTKAVNTHCKGVSKVEVPTDGGKQEMLAIPEGDVYRLIVKSQLPSAAKFETWVFDEVLPSIRKTGFVPKAKIVHELLELELKAVKEVSDKVEAVNTDLQSFKMDILGLSVTKDYLCGQNTRCQCLRQQSNISRQPFRGKSLRISRSAKRVRVGTYKAIKSPRLS